MKDFYMNITSQNNSYDYSNITSNYSNITSNYSNNTEYYKSFQFITDVVTCIFCCIGLPLTLVAIYALFSQIRNDQVAPIYVINLLISDLIQFCCMIVEVIHTADLKIIQISSYIHHSALMVSVVFMVCIALERYLVIAHPLWYRFRRTIKISVGVCVLVWVLAPAAVIILYFGVHSQLTDIIFGLIIFLPLPLFMFFLVGTLKALSASISVPSDEKRRIVGVLVLVLLIYTLQFLPSIILYYNDTLHYLSYIFVKFSPLADLTLYIFMRKGIIDKFLSSVCCCRMDSDDTNSSSV